jgi:hypothetical protein
MCCDGSPGESVTGPVDTIASERVVIAKSRMADKFRANRMLLVTAAGFGGG